MADADKIQFGQPSPLRSKLASSQPRPHETPLIRVTKKPTTAAANPSIFLQRKPFRAGHAPQDTMTKVQSQMNKSPSSFPVDEALAFQRALGTPSLPTFKKKEARVDAKPLQQPASSSMTKSSSGPMPIRVPKVGETPADRLPKPKKERKPLPPMPVASTAVDKVKSHGSSSTFASRMEERNYAYEQVNEEQAASQLMDFLNTGFDVAANDEERTDRITGLKCRLMPHQVDGLAFLKLRETKANGGLLADDMGLGKTVQTMALMLALPKPTDQKCVKSTLVVAPLSLLEQWAGEIESKTNLTVYRHHGPSRKRPREFIKYDVVLTTYHVLVSEHATHNPALTIDNDRGVFGVTWHRIVLDEAHTIKNRSAKMSLAACALRGVKRWCLTGTPIQNSVEDLFSLLRFLQIRPFNEFSEFKEKISGPIKRGRTKLAMKRLGVVLAKIMLRRTKSILKDAFALPPRNVQHVLVDFTPTERTFYTGLETRADERLRELKADGELGYVGVLVLLQRLRQACNHAQLVTKALDPSDYRVDLGVTAKKTETGTKKDEVEEMDEMTARLEAVAVVKDEMDDLVNGFSAVSVTKKCSICSVQCEGERCAECTAVVQLKTLALSAKVDKMLQILEKQEGKAILFSQWTSMLDLCAPFLEAKGVRFVKYYGSMPNKHREASLEALRSDPDCKVLLCSLKAGALGLNLTAAHLVFMMDVWWNPAIEEQAIDRVHRIGQTREVKVFKLTVRDTVEDRIVALQDKKRAIAQSALGEGGKMVRLGMDELLALFHRRAELSHAE